MRRLALFSLTLAATPGCTGMVRSLLQEDPEQAEKTAPAWVHAAKENRQLGPVGYGRLLAEAKKRDPGEPVRILVHLETTRVRVEAEREVSPQMKNYLADAFIPSLNMTWGMFTTAFPRALTEAALPGMSFFEPESGCVAGASWYETVRDCGAEADVFLFIQIEPRAGLPQCPEGRGYHLSARVSSSYERQDFSVELDVCRDTRAAAALLASKLVPQIDTGVRPMLPAVSETLRLTPGYRYDAWLAALRIGAGSGHHSHHHH